MIRVMRIMEYLYADAEAMAQDMEMWQVQGSFTPSHRISITSTTLPLELIKDDEVPV